ncbi:MAG: hypothetical protein VSS52_007245, partial [Thiotrichaceae bacterium]
MLGMQHNNGSDIFDNYLFSNACNLLQCCFSKTIRNINNEMSSMSRKLISFDWAIKKILRS